MQLYLAIALGGAAGGALRTAVNLWLGRFVSAEIPLGIWVVNLSGSLTLGILLPLIRHPGWLMPETYWFLVVGLFGSYTTVSTFALQSVDLLQGPRWRTGIVYVSASIIGCSVAAAIGLTLGHTLAGWSTAP